MIFLTPNQVKALKAKLLPQKDNKSSAAAVWMTVATIDMGRKEGAAVPLLRGELGAQSNTMWSGPRSTSIPSGVFIHPAVWSQQTWAKNWGGAVPLLAEGSWVPI